jgi:hypothetical protein
MKMMRVPWIVQTRLEMLANYRKQLLELQGKAGTYIDAAIKIASELSNVQSNLEQALGQAAFQTKRTTTACQVERRGVALSTNEPDLYQSSIPSLAHQRRDPAIRPNLWLNAEFALTSNRKSRAKRFELPYQLRQV